MDLKKTSVLLEKINALHNNMKIGNGTVSTIEKDLMLSYIRELYESVLAKEQVNRTKPNYESEVIRKKVEPVKPAPVKVEPVVEKPRIIEIPDHIKEELETNAPPIVLPKIENPVAPPKPSTTPPSTTVVPEKTKVEVTTSASEEIEALFDLPEAKELSEKLSASPIDDLTRSIALNDKLLYSNELFNGALVTFNEVVRTLNNMPDFNSAKNYLVELAIQHDWATKNKAEFSKNFIKLVRRRFT